jgi:hypothetical protein
MNSVLPNKQKCLKARLNRKNNFQKPSESFDLEGFWLLYEGFSSGTFNGTSEFEYSPK